jgi:PQQ-like domain
MNSKDILLLGLKSRVTAISKTNGQQMWSTEIPVRLGGEFVTLLCDGSKVFAYSSGRLHCLELATGSILWSNKLPGLGYGLATLCLSHGDSAPNTAAVQIMMDSESASLMALNASTTTA